MLILLPPSETKAGGGVGSPLDLDRLSFPDLNPVRRKLTAALVELAGDVPASRAALGLSDRQDAEIDRNAVLFDSPTMPALHRYTGVLYDALDAGSLTTAERRRAGGRLAVASALFGVVRATDPIPAYRCSGGSLLPGVGPLGAVWRPALEPVLGEVADLVVDLRSGTYATLARLPGAVTVRVVTDQGLAVSHLNKAHKGLLARALAVAPREPGTVTGLVRVAARAGLTLRRTGPAALELVAD
ncbi:MAG TPA: peroxide stress protein YaaA [Pseudonocardiaceae bacterium]|nr:peroxide stress protein YaaA [Pseudonocardiaceae bacterium]